MFRTFRMSKNVLPFNDFFFDNNYVFSYREFGYWMLSKNDKVLQESPKWLKISVSRQEEYGKLIFYNRNK